MSKKKDKSLNKNDREALMIFASKGIKCEMEKAAEDAAYEAAKPFVLQTVYATYPPDEMKILEKYGAARKDECIRFGGDYDNDSVFRFRSNDPDIPMAPRYTDCRSHRLQWSKEAKEALFAHAKALREHEKVRKSKMDDYRRLIVGSRTFNDVAAVWPAVELMRDKIIPQTPEQRAVAVLSEDAIARIRADNAGSQ